MGVVVNDLVLVDFINCHRRQEENGAAVGRRLSAGSVRSSRPR